LYIDFHNLEKHVAPFFMTEVSRVTMLMGYISKYKRNGPEAQEKLLSETQEGGDGTHSMPAETRNKKQPSSWLPQGKAESRSIYFLSFLNF
jgi:hypothetical protein